MNDEIFSSAGITWRSPEPMPDQWYESARFEQFQREALIRLENEFGRSPLFVIKDPRVCKLVPFWLSVLEKAAVNPAIVNMVRSPDEVAGSLLKRNGIDRPLGKLLWLRYVLGSEKDSRSRARVHLTYDALLADWQAIAQTISGTFDIRWPAAATERVERITDFLSDAERHHWEAPSVHLCDDVGSWATQAYAILKHWADHEESASDQMKLDAIAARFDEAVQPLLAPLLISYEKAASVHKLQAIRSTNDAEIEQLKSDLLAVQKKVSAFAVEFGAPLIPRDEAGPSVPVEVITNAMDGLSTAISARRETLTRELVDLGAERDQIVAELCEAKGHLTSKNAEVALEKKQQVKLAARLNEQKSELAGRYEKDMQASALRESQFQQLLALERDQRLKTETRLEQVQRINASLLIVRGRFEAASEELARLKEERDEIQKRAEDVQQKSKNELHKAKDQADKLKVERNKLAGERDKLTGERENLKSERDKLQTALTATRDDRDLRIEERDNRIRELARAVKRLKKKAEEDRRSQLERDEEAGTPSPLTPGKEPSAIKQMLRSLIPGSRRRDLQDSVNLVRNSGLFDANYYLERYPDLQGNPDELLAHYITHGGHEGRAPSAAFNGREYLRKYPDVAAAGLNPLVHFLQCGKDEGRAHTPEGKPKSLPPPAPVECSVHDHQVGPRESEAAKAHLADVTVTDIALDREADTKIEVLNGPTIGPLQDDRAPLLDSFSALATGASDWLRSSTFTDTNTLTVGSVAVAVENPSAESDSGAALSWFDALNFASPVAPDCDARMAVRSMLCDNRLRIEDAWLPSDFTVRIRLSIDGGEPLVVRCCQSGHDGNVSLRTEQALVAQGSIVFDISLASRFTAILLVFSDHEGRLIDSALVPFPTLLRGGIHHGELINHMSSATGSEAHEFYASKLLVAFADKSAPPAICDVSVALKNANGTEPIFSVSFRDWLYRQFGIRVTAKVAPVSDDPGLFVLSKQMQDFALLKTEGRLAGRTLLIGANSIPSLQVLLAREADLADASAVRTIVVDELTRRPLRAVDHPIIDCGNESLLEQAFEPPLVPGDSSEASATVVCISFSTATFDVRVPFPVAGNLASAFPNFTPIENAPISAIVRCTGSLDGLPRLLASLAHQRSVGALECLLIGNVPDVPDSVLLPFDTDQRVTLVRTEIRDGTPFSLLHAAVAQATHDRLLIVDDQKVLHDPRTLSVLTALCELDETGTAGCHVVSVLSNKNGVEKYKARAGWVAVSNGRSPQVLKRPDVRDLALPPLYPVLANPLGCLLIKRELWPSEVNGVDGLEADLQHPDMTLGIAMFAKGKMNIASSLISISDCDETSHGDVEASWLATIPRRFIAVEDY
ncbi:MAG: hypothetical protein ABIW58_03675 [Sphingomicrobium sp.]